MSNTSSWREYQEAAAAFFRRLGLNAQVDFPVEGARTHHNVDVYVEGSLHGIAFQWIVECKAWKSNVPKEKVMALAAIVQDTGADRGFLLSEVGFQSGALRAAKKTNITLTSLDDLAATSDEMVLDTAIGRLHWRLEKAQRHLRRIKKEQFDDDYYPPMTAQLGRLFVLESALQDALVGEYPNIYRVDADRRYQAESLDELMKAADEIIAEAESWEPPKRSSSA